MTTQTELQDKLDRVARDRRSELLAADRAADRAADLARVRLYIERRAEPLTNVLSPIDGLHKDQTWQGNAADQSRTRLDGHHTRLNTATARIDQILDDLASARRSAITEHENAESTAYRLLLEIRDIEYHLGRFDDVNI